jgi:heptosyltransferase II
LNIDRLTPEESRISDRVPPPVGCVLLNWNGWRDTLLCLETLARLDYPNFFAVVVDNGSTNDSVARIRAAYPDVPLVETGKNLGFAGGVNAGIRYVLQRHVDFVWLLNNDTEPRPDALTELVRKAVSDPAFGAVGSVLLYAHDPKAVQAWGGGRINRWVGHASHAVAPRQDAWFDYLTFASVLLSRRALEEVGLLDESYFLYWEDGDLSFRLRRRGWKLGVASGATVLHKENASSGGDRSKVDRFSTASGIRFLRSYAPLAWLSVPLYITLRIAKRLLMGRFSRIGDVTGGVRDYLASRRDSNVPPTTARRRVVVYGAFKGMGDLVSAAPVIRSELDAGAEVHLLIFPQIGSFVGLLDFGPNQGNLRTHFLPVSGKIAAVRTFFRQMSGLSPDVIWCSPHAPRAASSWKIPLLLWLVKKRSWPQARFGGAASERLSWLFDVPVAVDRALPFKLREWTAFALFRGDSPLTTPPRITFKQSIQQLRRAPPAYDLLIHPGAGADNRRWPAQHHAEMLRLLPPGLRIAVLGLPSDIAAMKQVMPADRNIEYLTGSLEEAIASIARTRVAFTMDSGTTFFADVLGIPTVALFGASDPAHVIGLGGPVVPIYELKWPCQPCGSTQCSQKAVYCMNAIEPAQVARTVLRLLQATP